jgi:hypothetical protein
MSDLKQARCEQSYENLKQLYKTLRARLDPHLSVLALAELGVDVSMVDLYKETARGGPYYLPMSQSRLQILDERPNFVPGFPWMITNGTTQMHTRSFEPFTTR